MSNIIFTQLKEHFKELLEERERYLKTNESTRANGYYTRNPKTIFGEMELNIPRTRDGKFKTSIMPERKRVTFMLDDVVRALFIAGVSSRKVGETIKNLIGVPLSPGFICEFSDISEEVISRFKNRELEDSYPVLYIDATYIPLKRDSVEKEAIYVVMGLKKDGTRDILSYQLPGGSEKAIIWKEILEDLKQRGLKTVNLVISDDLKGLGEAINDVFFHANHQLCWFHLKKNIKSKVRRKHWNEIFNELNEIINAKNRDEGKNKMEEFIFKKKIFLYVTDNPSYNPRNNLKLPY